MSSEVCSKCERRVGEEVLRCPLHRAKECPFVLKTISNQESRKLAWSLVLLGSIIVYFTLPLAKPQDYVSSTFVIIELVSISFLFIVSFLAIGVGYIILRTKKLIAYDPASKNIWEKQIVGGIELHSIIISGWEEYNFLVKFKPLDVKISETLRYPEAIDPKLNQAIFLSNVILNLIIQGYLKVFTAEEYQVSGQALGDITDRQKIYLATSKSLSAGAGELENLIYQTVCNLQLQQGAHFAVQLNDMIDVLPTFNYSDRPTQENHDPLVENISLLDSLKYKFNSRYLEQEIYSCLAKKQNTIWRTIESLFTHQYFRSARVYVVSAAFLAFLVVRFYLPLYKVEKLADKIDNQKVVDFVDQSLTKAQIYSRYLKDQSGRAIDFSRVQQDLKSDLEDVRLQAVMAANSLEGTLREQAGILEADILRLLNDKSKKVQNETLSLLEDWEGSLNFASADLFNLLGSDNPQISYKAAEILGKSDIDPRIAIPVLRGYLNHKDILTRLAVEGAIKSLTK